MRCLRTFFILLAILAPTCLWAGNCVSVDTVTKCARLPTDFMRFNIEGAGDYTDSSWSIIYDGVVYSGNSAECTELKIGHSCQCVVNSPFNAVIEMSTGLIQFDTAYEACSGMLEAEMIASYTFNGKLDGDICPDGFYTVPYEISCGEGFVDTESVPNCDDDTSGDYCLIPAAVTCDAGYYVNDLNECEICPAGYFCSDGKIKSECPRNMVELSDVVGATSSDECAIHSIPPGKYIPCNDNTSPFYLKDCPSGSYCTGVLDTPLTPNTTCSSWGVDHGRVYCGMNIVGPIGATSEDECCDAGQILENNVCATGKCNAGFLWDDGAGTCVLCPVGHYCNGIDAPFACPPAPEIPGEWWAAGPVAIDDILTGNGLTGTVMDCAFKYIYGKIPFSYSESLDMMQSDEETLMKLFETHPDLYAGYMMAGAAILGGVRLIENPNYVADMGINKRGGGALIVGYDPETNQYIFGWQPMTCNRGYWAEYGFKNPLAGDDAFIADSMDGLQPYLCQPVGREYWGAGSIFDMESFTVSGGDTRTACPAGTYTTGYGPGADSADDCKVGCSDGFAVHNDECRQLCGAGITTLKTATGVVAPLFAEKLTTPALNVRYNNQICYANLVVGGAQNAVNVKYNDIVYHTVGNE